MNDVTRTSNSLLSRCLDVVQEKLDDARNTLESYRGYPSRERRYARHVEELETLILDIKRATGEPPAESDWIIDYADVDRRPEYFSGFGAEAAARRRFEQAQQQWTCRLFRRVDRSNYGTTQPPPAVQYACGTCKKPIKSGCYCSDACANADGDYRRPTSTKGGDHG